MGEFLNNIVLSIFDKDNNYYIILISLLVVDLLRCASNDLGFFEIFFNFSTPDFNK